jgi:hypothetical protein
MFKAQPLCTPSMTAGAARGYTIFRLTANGARILNGFAVGGRLAIFAPA